MRKRKKKNSLFDKDRKLIGGKRVTVRIVGSSDLMRYYTKIKKLERENSRGDVSFP